MPSEGYDFGSSEETYSAYWEKTRSEIKSWADLELPAYKPEGCIFGFTQNRDIVLENPDMSDPVSLGASISKILIQLNS